MRTGLTRIIVIFVLAAAMSGGFFVSRAYSAVVCSVQLTLSAPGSDGFVFQFQGTNTVGNTFSFGLAEGDIEYGNPPQGVTATITEEPQDGYAFGGIACDAGPGVVITEIHNGFTTDCVNVQQGTASCVITNILIDRPIPTLSEWGMIAVAAGLMIVGVFFAVRRRKAQAV